MVMSCNKEIGGYLSFEWSEISDHLDSYTLLNSGHNCLIYFLQYNGVKSIQLPVYTCPIIWESITNAGIDIIPYDVDDNLFPVDINRDMHILYTNYFGVNYTNVLKAVESFDNVIIDNSQAFYAPHNGLAVFYSPRKFFGVPDGGLLWPQIKEADNLQESASCHRCSHLLKRMSGHTAAGYVDFKISEAELAGEPIKKMSRLTRTLLAGIDLERVKKRRLANFRTLHASLRNTNLLELDLCEEDVPMVYPYRTSGGSYLRDKLIKHCIYIAAYWPDSGDTLCMKSESARKMAGSIIPLPIDQRYGPDDMERILEIIHG